MTEWNICEEVVKQNWGELGKIQKRKHFRGKRILSSTRQGREGTELRCVNIHIHSET